ncbi:MAG: polyribonucleotide nucleotidyltransferase [Bacillariaceae sp.]|jgi:polyribonucleotide nucleotidyltransferase
MRRLIRPFSFSSSSSSYSSPSLSSSSLFGGGRECCVFPQQTLQIHNHLQLRNRNYHRHLSQISSYNYNNDFLVHNNHLITNNSRRYFADNSDSNNISKNDGNNDHDKKSVIVRGHQIEFDISRRIANLTESTIVGKTGETIALITVASDYTTIPFDDNDDIIIETTTKMLGDSIKQICQQNNKSNMIPLTVEYRQRYHAVGKIPTSSANRTDNRRQTDSEILASRAIDRSIRPLLLINNNNGENKIHLTCSIQSYPVKEHNINSDGNSDGGDIGGGHPVSLAINSASLAMNERLKEPVAAVVLCYLGDGTILVDPSTATIQGYQQQQQQSDITNNDNNINNIMGELLYAGTKDSVIMMEFSGMLSEPQILDLIQFAHECIQPVIKTQEEHSKRMSTIKKEQQKNQHHNHQSDIELRKQLGLDTIIEVATVPAAIVPNNKQTEENESQNNANHVYDEAIKFVTSRLSNVLLRLFGAQLDGDDDGDTEEKFKDRKIKIHSEATDGMLLGKSLRGRREYLVKEEIKRILLHFKPSDPKISKDYHRLLDQDKSIINILGDTIHSQMLREAMKDASIKYKSRADGRGSDLTTNGCDTIRPISMDVPLFSDIVHGSALFTRGETQVLCTTTLGPPKDGILLHHNDPYVSSANTTAEKGNNCVDNMPYRNLPVGSLRYLRSQEYLESDLNSRKVRADREQTGDSGTFKDRRRAFLQYDFPAYCKGEVQSGPGNTSRREIGHGALAEKSILPVLPSPSQFPYAIRMTSEVTSSNGSSSMASICGVTLSLLDAGVPITAPVAGVSVGLVQDKHNNSHQLLLDITGTEDHFGIIDFKVAGTREKVTAFQLDVKDALSFSVIADALNLAKVGRNAILDEMKAQSNTSSKGDILDLSPRPEPKATAPRCSVVKFDPARKKDLLGPGGVVIRQMEDRFNVSLDLTQEGK